MTSSKGFYFHDKDFDVEEVAKRVSSKLDDAPDDIKEVVKKTRDAMEMDDLFESRFTNEWTGPNYTNGMADFDTPYSDLNARSRAKEKNHLRKMKGQFFYFVAEVIGESNTETVSCLVEIRGRAADDKTEFFIQEYLVGSPGI
jgi:hypothetical protein